MVMCDSRDLFAPVVFEAADPDIQAASETTAASAHYHIWSHMITCDHVLSVGICLLPLLLRLRVQVSTWPPKQRQQMHIIIYDHMCSHTIMHDPW